MKLYIDRSGLSAIGFCSPATSPFYKKCGCQILPSGVKRVKFVGSDGQELPPDYEDDDVIYLDGAGLMRAVQMRPGERLIAFRGSW